MKYSFSMMLCHSDSIMKTNGDKIVIVIVKLYCNLYSLVKTKFRRRSTDQFSNKNSTKPWFLTHFTLNRKTLSFWRIVHIKQYLLVNVTEFHLLIQDLLCSIEIMFRYTQIRSHLSKNEPHERYQCPFSASFKLSCSEKICCKRLFCSQSIMLMSKVTKCFITSEN